jgi:hypothetical protein
MIAHEALRPPALHCAKRTFAGLRAPPAPAGPEGFNVMVYDDRIRVSADVSLAEAKTLVKRLERRIKL